jgi:uncharacterized protein (TIGR00304 family)
MLDIVIAGTLLIFAGVVVVMIAIVLSAGRDGRSEVKGAGVIMIGPVPIVFGSDGKWVSVAIVLAIILLVLGLLYYVV